jgi:hypothetical protein
MKNFHNRLEKKGGFRTAGYSREDRMHQQRYKLKGRPDPVIHIKKPGI